MSFPFFNTFFFDLPGYGDSSGHPRNESKCALFNLLILFAGSFYSYSSPALSVSIFFLSSLTLAEPFFLVVPPKAKPAIGCRNPHWIVLVLASLTFSTFSSGSLTCIVLTLGTMHPNLCCLCSLFLSTAHFHCKDL